MTSSAGTARQRHHNNSSPPPPPPVRTAKPQTKSNASKKQDGSPVAQNGSTAETKTRVSNISPSFDMHSKCRHSLLSSGSPADLRGFLNLAVMALLFMNARLIMENIQKYGFLLSFPSFNTTLHEWPRIWPCSATLLTLAFFILAAFVIERAAFSKRISIKTAGMLHFVNLAVEFAFPVWVIHMTHAHAIAGSTLLSISLCICLKLVSFAHVGHDIRRARRQIRHTKRTDSKTDRDTTACSAEMLAYEPTLRHLMYFLMAPTLCFQLSYPRSKRIRRRFVVRRILEIAVCAALQIGIIQQYIVPALENSYEHLQAGDTFMIVQRILKLAIPSTSVWLLMFYGLFHSWLNLTAELLRFGDRQFYRDWWNSPDAGTYWRRWNLPVHNWLVRHMYSPLIRRGIDMRLANLIVFLFSAVFHEVLVAVPCHMVRLWAFWGMLLQAPVIFIGKWMLKKGLPRLWGNCLFWTLFCILGQPLLVLLIAFDFVKEQHQ